MDMVVTIIMNVMTMMTKGNLMEGTKIYDFREVYVAT